MSQRPPADECAAVRDALISGSFDRIGRDEVERHLAAHQPCAAWASNALCLWHILALDRGQYQPAADIADDVLGAYLDGRLPEDRRRHVEEACCHDLKLAARLRQLRQRRCEKRLATIDRALVIRLFDTVCSRVHAALAAPLENFHALYLHRPLAVAAAQTQRSTFQTPDGRFVVSVADKGARQRAEPHIIELGIRVHEPQWIGGWACYRVIDAKGNLAAAGLAKIDQRGNSLRLTVPPTEHAPYTVHVQMLDAQTSDLEAALEQLAGKSDAPGS